MSVEAAIYRAALLEADRILRERELGLGELRELVTTLERIRLALGRPEDPNVPASLELLRRLEDLDELLG